MTNRVTLLINRFLDGSGEALAEAIRTPSGVNVDLLRAYGRSDSGLPHFYGNEIPTRH